MKFVAESVNQVSAFFHQAKLAALAKVGSEVRRRDARRGRVRCRNEALVLFLEERLAIPQTARRERLLRRSPSGFPVCGRNATRNSRRRFSRQFMKRSVTPVPEDQFRPGVSVSIWRR